MAALVGSDITANWGALRGVVVAAAAATAVHRRRRWRQRDVDGGAGRRKTVTMTAWAGKVAAHERRLPATWFVGVMNGGAAAALANGRRGVAFALAAERRRPCAGGPAVGGRRLIPLLLYAATLLRRLFCHSRFLDTTSPLCNPTRLLLINSTSPRR